MIKKHTIVWIKPSTFVVGGETRSKITFLLEGQEKKYIDSYCGDWNKDYAIGTEIAFCLEVDKAKNPDIPFIVSKKWEKGEKSGYNHNLYAPANAKFQGVSKKDLDELEKRVSALEVAMLGEKDEDAPDDIDDVNADVAGDEIRDDDIPF